MRVVVAGLGIQGRKRLKIAGADIVATVDPVVADAQYKTIQEVPLTAYDAVLACVPDDAKASLLRYLLSNGKHVLVEKPLIASPADMQDIHKLALSSKAVCYTAYNHRFEPHIESVRSLIQGKTLGKIYLVKIFYGNGTARDVRNSQWRDKGMGVVPDLGSHLLDMVDFIFDEKPEFFLREAFCFENKAFDYAKLCSRENKKPYYELEMTLLSWRNTFRLDIFGEMGSAHIDCLCKWGPSVLQIRKRVFPSGRPEEDKKVLECADPTWQKEYDYFKKLCAKGSGSNIENDLWIHAALENAARSAHERGFV